MTGPACRRHRSTHPEELVSACAARGTQLPAHTSIQSHGETFDTSTGNAQGDTAITTNR